MCVCVCVYVCVCVCIKKDLTVNNPTRVNMPTISQASLYQLLSVFSPYLELVTKTNYPRNRCLYKNQIFMCKSFRQSY